MKLGFLLLLTMVVASAASLGDDEEVVYGEYNVSLPRFRFQYWDDLEDETQELAALIGYNNNSWDVLKRNGIENLTYFEFEDIKKMDKDYKYLVEDVDKSVNNVTEILAQIGFDEDTYDCWMNHWSWYDWKELEAYELDFDFVELGWDEDAWNSADPDDWPESDLKAWANLTVDEKQAAANLCYINATWDGYWFYEFLDESPYLNSVEPWLRTEAPTSAPPSMGFCFPATARVTVEGKGVTKLADVQLGEKVMVQDGSYETVYSFAHYDPEIRNDAFMTLTTSAGKSLTLTPNHMIMTGNKGTVPASSVKEGDSLITSTTQEETVTRITNNVVKRGMYAPFTASGYLVVDDVVVSNYIAVQESDDSILGLVSHQWVAHAFNAPHRFYCNQISDCTTETYTKEGHSTWVATPLSLIQWIMDQSTFVKTLGTMAFVMVIVVFKMLTSQPFMLTIFGALFAVMNMRRRNRKTV